MAYSPSTVPDQAEARLTQLERQLERGYTFSHSVVGESMMKTSELQVLLHGLLDTLIAKGLVSESELLAAMHRVREELVARDEMNWQRAMVRNDGEASPATGRVVNCQERLHICKSACCKLDFALNIPELEASEIKWDLGRPYFIRHDSNGYCTHLDCASGRCGVYENRPGVCRGYSCDRDERIWKNFDQMELNQEWIEANLSATSEPHLINVFMHDRDRLQNAAESSSTENREVIP